MSEEEVRARIDEIYIKWRSIEITEKEKIELKFLDKKLKDFMTMDRMRTRGYSRYT